MLGGILILLGAAYLNNTIRPRMNYEKSEWMLHPSHNYRNLISISNGLETVQVEACLYNKVV